MHMAYLSSQLGDIFQSCAKTCARKYYNLVTNFEFKSAFDKVRKESTKLSNKFLLSCHLNHIIDLIQ